MPDDTPNNHLSPPRRRPRLYAGVIEDRPRTVEDLLADVLFGAYWHGDYYRTLPPELKPWESALAPATSSHPLPSQRS